LLFRSFGEDYHEKKLEETHVFPTIKKTGGPAAAYVDILIAQHQRGREITDYVLAVTGKGAIGTGDAEPLARALDSVELMYADRPDSSIRLLPRVFDGEALFRARDEGCAAWEASRRPISSSDPT
jgi:hypothetical protein